MNLTWFYLHCVAAVAILWADYTDRLEPAFNNFEQSIGLYTEPDTTDSDDIPPFYIDPFEEQVDSTWILPPIDFKIDTNLVNVK